jgi:hypothetical protein
MTQIYLVEEWHTKLRASPMLSGTGETQGYADATYESAQVALMALDALARSMRRDIDKSTVTEDGSGTVIMEDDENLCSKCKPDESAPAPSEEYTPDFCAEIISLKAQLAEMNAIYNSNQDQLNDAYQQLAARSRPKESERGEASGGCDGLEAALRQAEYYANQGIAYGDTNHVRILAKAYLDILSSRSAEKALRDALAKEHRDFVSFTTDPFVAGEGREEAMWAEHHQVNPDCPVCALLAHEVQKDESAEKTVPMEMLAKAFDVGESMVCCDFRAEARKIAARYGYVVKE